MYLFVFLFTTAFAAVPDCSKYYPPRTPILPLVYQPIDGAFVAIYGDVNINVTGKYNTFAKHGTSYYGCYNLANNHNLAAKYDDKVVYVVDLDLYKAGTYRCRTFILGPIIQFKTTLKCYLTGSIYKYPLTVWFTDGVAETSYTYFPFLTTCRILPKGSYTLSCPFYTSYSKFVKPSSHVAILSDGTTDTFMYKFTVN